MDAIEFLLFNAIEESLATTGDPTKLAFLWYLHHEGIPFSKSSMNIVQLESKLKQFFGTAAHVIIQMIYQRFMTKAMSEGYFSDEMIQLLEKLPKNSNTETILRLAVQDRKGTS